MSPFDIRRINAAKLLSHGKLPGWMIDMENKIYLQILDQLMVANQIPSRGAITNSIIGARGEASKSRPKTQSRAKRLKEIREARKRDREYVEELKEQKETLERQIKELARQLGGGSKLLPYEASAPVPVLESITKDATVATLTDMITNRKAVPPSERIVGIPRAISNIGKNSADILKNQGLTAFLVQSFAASTREQRENIIEEMRRDALGGTQAEKLAVNQLMGTLVHEASKSQTDSQIPPDEVAVLQDMIKSGEISTPKGKKWLETWGRGVGINQIMKLVAASFLAWTAVTGLTMFLTADLYDVSEVHEAQRGYCPANSTILDKNQTVEEPFFGTDEPTPSSNLTEFAATAVANSAETAVSFVKDFFSTTVGSRAMALTAGTLAANLKNIPTNAKAAINTVQKFVTKQFGSASNYLSTSIAPLQTNYTNILGQYATDFNLDPSNFIRNMNISIPDTIQRYSEFYPGVVLPNFTFNPEFANSWRTDITSAFEPFVSQIKLSTQDALERAQDLLEQQYSASKDALAGSLMVPFQTMSRAQIQFMNFLARTVPSVRSRFIKETALAIYPTDVLQKYLNDTDEYTFTSAFEELYQTNLVNFVNDPPSDEFIAGKMAKIYGLVKSTAPRTPRLSPETARQGPKSREWFEIVAGYLVDQPDVEFNEYLADELRKSTRDLVMQGNPAVSDVFMAAELKTQSDVSAQIGTPQAAQLLQDATEVQLLVDLKSNSIFNERVHDVREVCGLTPLLLDSVASLPKPPPNLDSILEMLDNDVQFPDHPIDVRELSEDHISDLAVYSQKPHLENQLTANATSLADSSIGSAEKTEIRRRSDNIAELLKRIPSKHPLDSGGHKVSKLPFCSAMAMPFGDYTPSAYAIGGGNDCGCGYEEEDECSVDVGVAGYAF